jgi:hypothetical protein
MKYFDDLGYLRWISNRRNGAGALKAAQRNSGKQEFIVKAANNDGTAGYISIGHKFTLYTKKSLMPSMICAK